MYFTTYVSNNTLLIMLTYTVTEPASPLSPSGGSEGQTSNDRQHVVTIVIIVTVIVIIIAVVVVAVLVATVLFRKHQKEKNAGNIYTCIMQIL